MCFSVNVNSSFKPFNALQLIAAFIQREGMFDLISFRASCGTITFIEPIEQFLDFFLSFQSAFHSV